MGGLSPARLDKSRVRLILAALKMRFRAVFPAASFALAALAMAAPAQGSIPALLQHAANELRRDGAPGVAIVAVVKGRTYYENAGTSDPSGAPVTPRTLFETASISKVFTTTLLGIEVAQGHKSLGARITKYIHRHVTPEMAHATLGMLATYTAGIPNLPPALARRPSDEWGLADYSVRKFVNFIARLRPGTLPAARVYSDASVGFLALCLSHMNLAAWQHQQERTLYFPLGMRDTTAIPNADQASRLAQGITPDGLPAKRWPLDAFAAADGVKSTTHDLGKFLGAELGRERGLPAGIPLGMEISTQPRFSIANGTILQALAWTWVPAEVHGTPIWIVTKGGNLVGFCSRISFNRNLKIGVAILASHPSLPVDRVATNLLEQIAQQEYASVRAER